MDGIIAKTLEGGTARLSPSAVESLRASLAGRLLTAANDGYDEARSIWNAMFDRHPALIVRCANAQDVIAAVDFAREHGLLLAVRGGGHNIAGHSVCEGGVMIDLSPMNGVKVDSEARTARVEAGAPWADVDRETQAFGLAVPSGVVSTTGVAGLTLGGGFGRLSRKHGLTIDNLLSADIVTAQSELVTASADVNSDLFWGIRGGGGNFGIVTAFEFRLHPVGPEVIFGPIVYRLEDAREVLDHYADFAAAAPRELSIFADLMSAPPLPFLPDDIHGTKVLFVVPFYAGDLDAGEALIAPLREYGDPVGDGVGRVPYAEAQQAVDELYSAGAQNYWKAHNFARLGAEAINIIVAFAQRLPTPQSDILISHVGGAINDVAREATAYPHRGAEFIVSPGARWEDSGANDAAVEWVRDCIDELTKHAAGGSYANFIAEEEGRARDAFASNLERLTELKKRFDPGNLFRLNQNISPSGEQDAAGKP